MEGFLLLAKGYKQLKILHLLPAVSAEQCHLLNKQRQLKTAMNLPSNTVHNIIEATSVNSNIWFTILSFNRISACIEIKLFFLGSFQYQVEVTLSFHEQKRPEGGLALPTPLVFLGGCFTALSKACNLAIHSPIISFFQMTTPRTQHKAISAYVSSLLQTLDPC